MIKGGEMEGLITALDAEGVELTPYGTSEELVDLALDGLHSIIERLLPLSAVTDALLKQKEWHDGLAAMKAKGCLPDPRLVSLLSAHLQGNASLLINEAVYSTPDKVVQGLIVLGAAGSGKSSLMASVGIGHRFSCPDDLTMM